MKTEQDSLLLVDYFEAPDFLVPTVLLLSSHVDYNAAELCQCNFTVHYVYMHHISSLSSSNNLTRD